MQACEWCNELQDGEPRAKPLAAVIDNECVESYQLLLIRLRAAVHRLFQKLTLGCSLVSGRSASTRIVRVLATEHRLWVLERIAAIVSLLLPRRGHIPHSMPTDQGARLGVLGYPMVVIAYKGEDGFSGRGHCSMMLPAAAVGSEIEESAGPPVRMARFRSGPPSC